MRWKFRDTRKKGDNAHLSANAAEAEVGTLTQRFQETKNAANAPEWVLATEQAPDTAGEEVCQLLDQRACEGAAQGILQMRKKLEQAQQEVQTLAPDSGLVGRYTTLEKELVTAHQGVDCLSSTYADIAMQKILTTLE